jgi:c-di-GMP-binding flagellar brake protein YcgR
MDDISKEKRQFPRTSFSGENGLSGIFRLPEPYNESVKGIIRDLSMGGMGISLKKAYPVLIKGQRVILSEILDRSSLSFMKKTHYYYNELF